MGVWVRRILIVQGWLAFGLIFADAIDADFDIPTPVLNILGLIVVAAMLAMVLTLHRR